MSSVFRRLGLCVLLVGVFGMFSLASTPVLAATGINQQMNFQGRLLNAQGATVPDGYYNIQFKIYQDGDGLSVGDTTGSPAGSLKWTETYLNSNSQGVVVKNGYLSVQLGSVNPFGSSVDWNQSNLWLSMNIGGISTTCSSFSACSPDGEMIPMKRLSSSPYAMNAGQLGGLTASGFIQNTTTPQLANISLQSANAGNIGAVIQGATSQTADIFQVSAAGTGTPLLAVSATGSVALQSASGNTSALAVRNTLGNTVLSVDTLNNRVGISMGASETSAFDLGFGGSSDRTIGVNQSPVVGAGKTLTIQAGQGNAGAGGTLAMAGGAGNGSGSAGGSTTITGGAGGGGNSNGGDVTITGGAGTGTGTNGILNLGASAYQSATNVACAADCTIGQANIDNYGTVMINASTSGITMTLPPPTRTSATGRILYLTTVSGSSDFNLTTNTGANVINVAMRQNTTATMIWSGSAWTPGGASNATTLQATYNNGTNPATTPEIKLDPIRGTIDIQDADMSINSDLLDVRSSNTGGLGTVLFGVNSTGRVTIQGTTDQYSAFRVLNSNGNYLFNINSSNNYVLSNAISSAGNQLSNPGFETGGSAVGGEEGWFGSAVSSIVNDSANAHSGNDELQVTANSSNTDVYAGTYYAIQPGESLYFEGYVKNSAGANGSGGLQVAWYDKDKNLISNSTNYGTLPGTNYVLRNVSATAPAGAQYAQVSASVRSTATTGTYYFDDFYLAKNSQQADTAFRNSVNSTTAFRIQSAGAAQTLFNADTVNNVLKVGDSTGTDTATTLLVLDSATANPTSNLSVNNGGLFYRSDTNSLKAVIGGQVVDICTTAVTCSGYSASASSTIQLQSSTPGTAQTGNFNISGVGILGQLQTQDQSTSSTSSNNLVIRTGNATGATSNSGSLTIDVGTATGSVGTISIGHSGVSTTIGGNLNIQGSNSLALGTSSAASASILFRTAAGNNTITLKAPGANPTSSYSLTLPQNLGSAGDCLKDTGSGALGFSNCAAGLTVSLQNAYDNSSPANITLADGKDFSVTAQNTTTDPNILFNLQCSVSCAANGRFAIQNAGTDVLTVAPNGGGITLNGKTQIGSSVTDGTQTNFQLDSYNGSTDSGACTLTANQGALYYNTTMGSIRGCINGSWSDISNPDTLGLLTFGIVPSSGSNSYDLPSLVTQGYSGPCKVSYLNANQVHIEPCIAYSNGRRINLTSTTLSTNVSSAGNISLTTTNRWGHICLDPSTGRAVFTTQNGLSSPTGGMPAFSPSAPILCLADVVGSTTTSGSIGMIYDTRTFTSAMKEAVNVSTSMELGMLADAGGTNGAMIPASSGSKKLYGVIVATDGSTSTGAPNAIVTTVGPAWVKAIAGTAGQFIKTSITNGYGDTTASIPNNSFYYSAGNTRTSYDATCSSSSNCAGSLYVNFIVR